MAVDCVIERTSCCTSFDDPNKGSTIAYFENSIAQLVLLNVTIKQYETVTNEAGRRLQESDGCSPLFLAGPSANPELVLQNVALEMDDRCDAASIGSTSVDGFQSVNASGCSSTFTNSDGERSRVCSEFTDCVEAPLVPGAYVQNVICECADAIVTSDAPYPNDEAYGVHAPYYYPDGCLVPRRLKQIIRTSREVSVPVAKPSVVRQDLNLTLEIQGTDEAIVTWQIRNSESLAASASWLKLQEGLQNVSGAEDVAYIPLSLEATGLPEQAQPYHAELDIDVGSPRPDGTFVVKTQTVEVNMLVTSRTESFVWGRVPNGELCSSVALTRKEGVRVGEETAVIFTACDAEDFPVEHSLPSSTDGREFTARLRRTDDNSVSVKLSPTYQGAGTYELILTPERWGVSDVVDVSLLQAPVVEPLVLVAACPDVGQTVQLSAGKTCGVGCGAVCSPVRWLPNS